MTSLNYFLYQVSAVEFDILSYVNDSLSENN